MKVFKFGGAAVKDANGFRNACSITGLFPKEDLVIVVSAIGKTTNALEELTDAFFFKKGNAEQLLSKIKEAHIELMNQLFPDPSDPIYNEISNTFVELDWAIEEEPSANYHFDYDQIVSMGEILSSKILSAFLNKEKILNTWLDARGLIQTDNNYQEGKVNWELTEKLVRTNLLPMLNKQGSILVTQGFIGGTSENLSTTLGREGSDYTAAIIAFAADAQEVVIWKDVPGVLNADPKWFDQTKKIEQLSYQDAIELSYYGATVIHPKTIKPLQNKKIPLFVKSFIHPNDAGTVINDVQTHLPVPCFIFKVDQILISISPKDFSFIAEENLSSIFKLFADHGVKINVIQNSAISFSVSADNDDRKIPPLIEQLKSDFRVLYNDHLELITIRYYDQPTIDRVCSGKTILLEQKSRYTVQLVVKNTP